MLIARLAVFLLLFNSLTPKYNSFGMLAESDSFNQLLKSQPLIQYYSLFSTLPVKIMNELFMERNSLSPSAQEKRSHKQEGNPAPLASEFSLLAAGIGMDKGGNGGARLQKSSMSLDTVDYLSVWQYLLYTGLRIDNLSGGGGGSGMLLLSLFLFLVFRPRSDTADCVNATILPVKALHPIRE